jgi:hypothetical protein
VTSGQSVQPTIPNYYLLPVPATFNFGDEGIQTYGYGCIADQGQRFGISACDTFRVEGRLGRRGRGEGSRVVG